MSGIAWGRISKGKVRMGGARCWGVRDPVMLEMEADLLCSGRHSIETHDRRVDALLPSFTVCTLPSVASQWPNASGLIDRIGGQRPTGIANTAGYQRLLDVPSTLAPPNLSSSILLAILPASKKRLSEVGQQRQLSFASHHPS